MGSHHALSDHSLSSCLWHMGEHTSFFDILCTVAAPMIWCPFHSRKGKQPRHTSTASWNDLSKQLPESPDPSSTIASWRRGLCGFVVAIDIGLAWQKSCHDKMSKPNPGSPKTKLCALVAGILYIDSGRLFFVCSWIPRANTVEASSCSCFKRQVDSGFLGIVGFFFNVVLGCKHRIAQYCQVKAFIGIIYDNFTLESARLDG